MSFTAPSDTELRNLATKIIGKAKSQQYKVYMLQPRETRDGALDARDAIFGSKEHDWVIEAFEQFLDPSPWNYEGKMQKVKEMAADFDIGVKSGDLTSGHVRQLFDTVKGTVADNWHGALADNLVDDYLAPMAGHIPQNQGRCLLVAHDGLQAMRDIYAGARRDLKTLGDQIITSLEAADGTGINSVKTMLQVLNTIFTVGMAVLSAVNPAMGGAVGITSAVIAAGMAEVDKKAGEPEEVEADLASLYPDEVMDKLKTAIEKKKEDLTEAEDKLIKTLNQGAMDILMMATNGLFITNMLTDFDLPLTLMPQGSLLTPPIPDVATAGSGKRKDGLFQIDDK